MLNRICRLSLSWTYFAALALFVGGLPAIAQEPCGLYIQVDEELDSAGASLDVASYASCTKPESWAYARISLPGGRYANASASGTTYAEAFTQITINNESGTGSFSGYGESADQCWEFSDDTISFSDPFSLYNNTPVVTGINPGNWIAGQTTRVTFTGQYFGTNTPTLTFSDNAISSSLVSYNDTQIVADVSVPSPAPDESVTVTVTNNGYAGQGFQSGGGAVSQNSQPANARVVASIPAWAQITVIGWINGDASDLATLNKTGVSAKLIANLDSSIYCSIDVSAWLSGWAKDISTQSDRDYANTYMIKYSANSVPPNTINVSSQLSAGSFRAFHNFGGGPDIAEIGRTPDPCQLLGRTPIAAWIDKGSPSSWNGKTGSSVSGKIYHVNEGRVGFTGQRASMTINQGRTVPFVYSVVALDPSTGNVTLVNHSTFPTFYVYINGQLNLGLSSNQSTVKAFVTGYDQSNETAWQPVP